MNIATLVSDPSKIHQAEDEDLELYTRQVVDLLTTCENFAPGSKETADAFLDYAAEIYKREPILANAMVDVYTQRGGCISMLVKRARARRKEVSIGGWLSYLKSNLMQANGEHQRKFLRKVLERACLWMGLSPEETIAYLDRHQCRDKGSRNWN